MLVLSFWDPKNRLPTVDLLAECPVDFDALYGDSLLLALATTVVRVASVEHLIAIKRAAGRPQDLDDVKRLTDLRTKKNNP